MSSFIKFLKSSGFRLKILLTCLALIFIPAPNYYYSLQSVSAQSLIRPDSSPLLSLSDYPVNITGQPPPYLSAQSAVVIDVDSKAVIFQKNPDFKLLPASTTKIMTGLIVLENFNLDQVITINSVHQTGQVMKLQSGEKITVANLLYGLLVQSANDAATILAQAFPGGEDAFITAMNQKAKDLKLESTQFTNAVGLDAYGHYTTAHDLALLAAYAMANPTFKKMVSTIGITVADVDNTIQHDLENINQLLGQVPGLSGVKTGWTDLAGECFVSYTKRNSHQIISVVLASQDRFGETQQLINWVFANHQWQAVPLTTH